MPEIVFKSTVLKAVPENADRKDAEVRSEPELPPQYQPRVTSDAPPGTLEKLNTALRPMANPPLESIADVAPFLLPNPMQALGGGTLLASTRGSVGRGVQAAGRGMETVGKEFKPVHSTGLGALAFLSHHPYFAGAALTGPPALRVGGKILQRTGRMIEGGAPVASHAPTNLSTQEQALQRALQILKEERTARAGARAATPAEGLTGELTTADRARIQGRLDQAHTASGKTAAASTTPPGSLSATDRADLVKQGYSPEVIAKIEQAAIRAAQPAEAAAQGAPGGSLGDLGRAISTDRPRTGGATGGAPPMGSTSAETVFQQMSREGAFSGPRTNTGFPEGPGGLTAAAEGKLPRYVTPPTDPRITSNPAQATAKPTTTPKPGPRSPEKAVEEVTERAKAGPGASVKKPETQPLPEMPAKPHFNRQTAATLQKLKEGQPVEPEQARAALQTLRDALGSEEAAKHVGMKAAQLKKQTTGGQMPTIPLRKVLAAVDKINTPDEARAYLSKASPNIRLTVETILRRKGLL